jgi:hypothetical protein
MVISRTSQTEICRLEFEILTSTPQSDQRPCPLCGALERRLVFQRDGWHVVKCSACNMVFIGDQPLAYGTQASEHDWVDDYEKEVSRRKKDRPLLMFFSRLTRPFRTGATQRQFSHAIHWKRDGKLLDLGCGDGRFLAMAARQFDVTGVELSARAAQAGKRASSTGADSCGSRHGCRSSCRFVRCRHSIRIPRARMATPRGPSGGFLRAEIRWSGGHQDTELRELEPHRYA